MKGFRKQKGFKVGCDPELVVQDCDCGSVKGKCDRFVIGIVNPILKPLKDRPSDVVYMAYVPIGHAEEIVSRIREFAARKGVLIS